MRFAYSWGSITAETLTVINVTTDTARITDRGLNLSRAEAGSSESTKIVTAEREGWGLNDDRQERMQRGKRRSGRWKGESMNHVWFFKYFPCFNKFGQGPLKTCHCCSFLFNGLLSFLKSLALHRHIMMKPSQAEHSVSLSKWTHMKGVVVMAVQLFSER